MIFKKPMSALWLWKRAKQYDQWAGDSYEGTSIMGAGIAMRKEGSCEDKYYPYSLSRHSAPAAGAETSARQHKTPTLFGLSVKRPEHIVAILKSHIPVPVAVYVHQQFYTARSNGFMEDEGAYFSSPRKGGHAMAIVGWTHKDGERYWILRNSWGSYFGRNGNMMISEHCLTKISKGAFVISAKSEDQLMSWWQRHLPWALQIAVNFIINSVKSFFK
jgi:C1A family cysteine protease